MSLNEIGQRKNAAKFLEDLLIVIMVIISSIIALAVNTVVKSDILINLVIVAGALMLVTLISRYTDFKDLLEVIKHSSSGGSGVDR